MKRSVRITALLSVACLLLSSCAKPVGDAVDIIGSSIRNSLTERSETVDGNIPLSSNNAKGDSTPEAGSYNEGIVLVKYDGEMTDAVLDQLSLKSASPLYEGSKWYTLELCESADTVETVEYLRALDIFENVDYDYIMTTGADASSAEVDNNPKYKDSEHFDTMGVDKAWDHRPNDNKLGGGSRDVVVAVIDTGVDYTHLDLRNNIWINSGEIPGNGIDDDGNGYVDDVYGWNFVGDDNDPMDDNGHGTHVAGIIAAENNSIGNVGIAYNCKVMVLKAGNSSGYFNNADIAEAVMYAYMNGASVINMSFGGSMISLAVEDALKEAYNSCVLVAAAGNDHACNNLECLMCMDKQVNYPAALPCVIGVMSSTSDGSRASSFTNYDHYPYNSIEYDVYAPGEGLWSTWLENKYASLNGTSMAAPTVSGIAALLRSAYPDRETYSTKYLVSQIVNTGEKHIGYYSVANVYDALTKLPVPDVKLYDYSIDDSKSISSANNGDGVIQAGETVRLFVSLQNRGGVASDVKLTLNNTDKYFTVKNSTLEISDIGTYSVRESGEDKYFEIMVSADCPNDYLVDFDISFEYKNGLDEKDSNVYRGEGTAQFNISRGFYLPSRFEEDTVYTNDRLYIVGEDVIIPEGITVTFKEGCEIQFYDDREYYNSPVITVYGTLNIEGTKENMVKIGPNESRATFACYITGKYNGTISIDYADAIDLLVNKGYQTTVSINNTILRKYSSKDKDDDIYHGSCYINGNVTNSILLGSFNVDYIADSYIELQYGESFNSDVFEHCIVNYGANWNVDVDSNDFRYNIVVSSCASGIRTFNEDGINSRSSSDNMFITMDNSPKSLISIMRSANFTNNTFSPLYQKYASQVINNYYDENGEPTVDVYGSCSDISRLWPYVVSVELFDKDGSAVTTIGKEEIKVRVTFNRPMDRDAGTYLTFGTKEPYADYRIDGEFISDTVWEGSYTLKANIENGQSFIKVNNAWAAEDQTKTVFGEMFLNEFTIDTTTALSMSLQAETTDAGIKLTWFQDDYDTLLGYNIYRSDKKDGNYVKLNRSILLPTDDYFIDDNAESGKTYWYTYTVVLSDFTESSPAGKVTGTMLDTLAPSIYHTPVNQGYTDNNLVISCTATDNIAVREAVLYYRTKGAESWKRLTMSKQSDRFSATVLGGELDLCGLEYYITASDGVNTVSKGSADDPYTVVIKDASAISRLGDVDGDGIVTALDALMIMQHIGDEKLLTDDQFKRADLNGDGELNTVEALRILQYVNGNLSSLEME